jgi:beta-xylosidase
MSIRNRFSRLQSRSVDRSRGDDYYIATSTFEWFPACRFTTRATS